MPENPFADLPPRYRRLPSALGSRLMRTRQGRALATRLFHRAYYQDQRAWEDSRWLGATALKTPQDLWIYQEIICETRPDLIIETGTFEGGSALYLATVCEALGHGRILSIDLRRNEQLPSHPRIQFITGSSIEAEVVDRVRAEVDEATGVMALLDSDHSRDHVFAELGAYGPLVTEGSYLIVEDTHINGNPVAKYWGPGPMEAVRDYLATGAPFEVDRSREKFLLSFNPRGFLKRLPRA